MKRAQENSLARGCLVGMLAIVACEPANEKARVHVVYEQIANFITFYRDPDSNDSHSPSPDGLYIMYRIKEIDNSATQAKTFVFKTTDLLIASGEQITNEDSGSDAHLLDDQFASPITVTAGNVLSKSKGLGCIIKIARKKDFKSMIGKMLDLTHTIDTTQPVDMDRDPANNSEALVIDALPLPLQSLCNTD